MADRKRKADDRSDCGDGDSDISPKRRDEYRDESPNSSSYPGSDRIFDDRRRSSYEGAKRYDDSNIESPALTSGQCDDTDEIPYLEEIPVLLKLLRTGRSAQAGFYGYEAIQFTQHKNGSPQQAIYVTPLRSNKLDLGKLQKEVAESYYWKMVRDMLTELFEHGIKWNLKLPYYSNIGTPATTVELKAHLLEKYRVKSETFAETLDDAVRDTYTNAIHHGINRAVRYGDIIFNGFLPKEVLPTGKPVQAMGNGVGRNALSAIFELCEDLPAIGQQTTMTLNVGGGASGYPGNLTYAEITKTKLKTDEVLTFLESCSVDKKNLFKVPDVQFVAEGKVKITGEVKSSAEMTSSEGNEKKKMRKRKGKEGEKMKCEDDAYIQTWTRALVGLAYSDNCYGVLLTPTKGIIMELCLLPPQPGQTYKVLQTRDHTWCFLDGYAQFSVQDFIGFVEAILVLMNNKKVSK